MRFAKPALKVYTTTLWFTPRLILITLVLLVLAFIASTKSYAQESLADPFELFVALMDDGHSQDNAMNIVAEEFQNEVAIALAVFWCSRLEEVQPLSCDGSQAQAWWQAFWDTGAAQQAETVEEVVAALGDDNITIAIAVDLCRPPDPLAVCQQDGRFAKAWNYFETADSSMADAIAYMNTVDPLVARAIAATACFEVTCYAAQETVAQADQSTAARTEQFANPLKRKKPSRFLFWQNSD